MQPIIATISSCLGSEIKSGWDTYVNLFNRLREQGLEDGIRVMSRYRDLFDRDYTTPWTINPLQVEGALDIPGPIDQGLRDLVKEAKKINRKLL